MFGVELSNGNNDEQLILSKKLIKKTDIERVGLNPRIKLNEEIIKNLKDIEDIEPLKLGYCEKDSQLEFEGISLAGKIFLVDGEHRYHSKENDFEFPCTVKKYESITDIYRDSVLYNLHGQRLKNEEIFKVIEKDIDFHFIKNLGDLKDLPKIKQISKTYKIDKEAAAALIFINVLKRKVDNINDFDCLKIKSTPGSSEETIKKYVVLAIKEFIKTADGVEIRRFLTEFTPYIRIMNYTKKEELSKIVKGYMDGEFVTYEEYLKTKETAGNSDEKLDLEAMLSGDGDESYDEEEEVKVNTDKSTKDTVVKSDVSLYTKKVHTSIKDAISYVSHVKTLKDTGKIALVTPKKEELTELEESLKNLLKDIEELKNN